MQRWASKKFPLYIYFKSSPTEGSIIKFERLYPQLTPLRSDIVRIKNNLLKRRLYIEDCGSMACLQCITHIFVYFYWNVWVRYLYSEMSISSCYSEGHVLIGSDCMNLGVGVFLHVMGVVSVHLNSLASLATRWLNAIWTNRSKSGV